MAVTFTQTKATLDEIANRSESARKNLARARQLILAARAELNSMGTDYSQFVQDLDTRASGGNADEAWVNAKSEKDLMVADFNTLQNRANSLLTAYDSVTE